MTRPHVLYYAQDPGGTRYLDPVIATLIDAGIFDWTILLHPFANTSVLMADKYATQRTRFSDDIPASTSFFEGVLNEHEPDVVVCTTSAQARDTSNGALIAATKTHGAPCLAALDHWKGLDRFFEGPDPRYFPDQLICIDDSTKSALGRAGLDMTKVHVVGHPGLEQIEHRKSTRTDPPWRVLLVSQPIVQNGAYHGIYDEQIDETRLSDHIAFALDDKDFEIFLRRHPKEHAGSPLPSGVRVDDISDWNTALAYYDVFVGFDSMALIEASLSGAPSVRLTLPEMAGISDQPVPFEYGVPATTFEGLAGTIRSSVSKTSSPAPNPFAGSTICATGIIKNFVNSYA